MGFETFYNKYIGGPKNDLYYFSKKGYEKMENSKDSLHNEKHVDNLFAYTDELFKRYKSFQNKLNMRVMFLAICWHDAWKAKKNSGNLIDLVLSHIAEGIMASRMFKKEAKAYQIDKDLVNKTAYAIKKHSQVQIRERKTLEAKVLKDVDRIETFNFQRYLEGRSRDFKFINRRHLVLTRLYVGKIAGRRYYFPWTKNVIIKDKANFIERFNKEIRNLN